MDWKSPPLTLNGHVVVCNASPQIRRIVGELHTPTVPNRPDVVLVVQDQALWRQNPEWQPDPGNEFSQEHFFTVEEEGGPADPGNLLAAGIRRAGAAVILADPRLGRMADARSTLVAMAIERHNRQVHTVMELIKSVNREHLRATEVNEVVCLGELSEKLIAQSCITPGVKNIFQSLLSNAPGTNQVYVAPLTTPLVGKTFRELAVLAVKKRAPFVLCGFIKNSFLPTGEGATATTCRGGDAGIDAQPLQTFVLNPKGGEEPGRDTALEEADQLISIAHVPPDLEAALLGAPAAKEGAPEPEESPETA